jgi:hypothetical protein
LGLTTYAKSVGARVTFIHRGVEVPERGDYRSAPVHNVVRQLKRALPDAGRYFDPSHSLGPRLRDKIVEETIKALLMTEGNDFLYTGLLIEAGTSTTDSGQHVTHPELKHILHEVGKYRVLQGPWRQL